LRGALGAVVSAGAPATVTVADCVAEPALLLPPQVSVYVWLTVRLVNT